MSLIGRTYARIRRRPYVTTSMSLSFVGEEKYRMICTISRPTGVGVDYSGIQRGRTEKEARNNFKKELREKFPGIVLW